MKLRLTIVLKNRVLNTLEFDQDRITIGRGVGNDIQLDNLALSREHAAIVRVHGGYIMGDLNSRNGLHVNGESKTRHHLNDGDVIAVGRHVLSVSLLESDPPAKKPLPVVQSKEGYLLQGRTLSLGPQQPPPSQKKTRRQTPVAHLTLMGDQRGVYPLGGGSFHVGRARDSDLRLPQPWAPRRLALIVQGSEGFSLLNVSAGGGGVFLNGKPVRGRCWLKNEDRLELGNYRARFREGGAREVENKVRGIL